MKINLIKKKIITNTKKIQKSFAQMRSRLKMLPPNMPNYLLYKFITINWLQSLQLNCFVNLIAKNFCSHQIKMSVLFYFSYKLNWFVHKKNFFENFFFLYFGWQNGIDFVSFFCNEHLLENIPIENDENKIINFFFLFVKLLKNLLEG